MEGNFAGCCGHLACLLLYRRKNQTKKRGFPGSVSIADPQRISVRKEAKCKFQPVTSLILSCKKNSGPDIEKMQAIHLNREKIGLIILNKADK